MIRARVVFAIFATACAGSQPQVDPPPPPANPATSPTPPVAEKRDHLVESPHGSRNDPYFWMRDDKRENADVLAHLKKENAYKDAMLAPTAELAETLYEEIVSRIKQDDSTVPTFKDGYWYYNRYEEGQQYAIFARKKTFHGTEEILLDKNKAAEGHDFYAASGATVSPDGNWMAYAEDTVGRNQFRLRIVDLRSGKRTEHPAENVQASIAWANDNKTIYYIEKHPKTLLGYRLRRHVVGSAGDADPLIYEEKDKSFYMGLGKTKSKAYVVLYLSSTVSSEMLLLDAATGDAKPVVFTPRERDHEYSIDHLDGRFVIKTNWKAKNFRLMEGGSGDRTTWKEIVPHRADAFIHSFDLHKDFIAVGERSEGRRKVRVLPKNGKPFVIKGDEEASTMYLSRLPSADSKSVRYLYSSMTTPWTTYEMEIASGAKETLKVQPVLGDFKSENYVTEWRYATARDGTKIPVSLMHKKGLKRDGSAPIIQYGYGSYGSSRDPNFSITRLSLVDRGAVYVNAHVRGGQEMGRAWYDAGRLANKMNTFTDFIDVTQFLVDEKYGDPTKVAALGGSAGGLLVGAVANLAPEKYRAILAWVPFVDVVTTMLDESIPLTSNEFDEWGNPRDKAAYDTMLTYSPYDNVKKVAYPSMLVTTGLWDSQVQYWEPAKWVAKLREHNSGKNPILFHINMDAGHGGKSGRFHRFRETARDYAWLLTTLAQPDPR